MRSTDGGRSWSAPVEVARNPHYIWFDEANRRFDIVWTEDGVLRWLPLRADNLDLMPMPRRLLAAADSFTSIAGPAGQRSHRLRSLVDWDGVLHAVVSTSDQLRLVPLP